MDQSGHYMSQRQPQLFQPPQLPPPSSLHLPAPGSFSRSNNTLPPIPNIPSNSRFAASSSYPPSNTSVLPPLPSSQSWSNHRSSPREEVYGSRRTEPGRQDQIKRESREIVPAQPDHKESEDGMPTTSDFVKKLYKMLEDASFAHIVSWGPAGDCFVVKDMNEFTKSVLPRLFKHSNFASFVRQLNKYDFHKVKNTDDNQFGEHSWTFRHPDFHASRPECLENIKRKVPAQRKSTGAPNGRTSDHNNSPGPSGTCSEGCGRAMESLQVQLEQMSRQQEEMAVHLRGLEGSYQNVLGELVNFQRTMAQQDGLMQNLIQYFLQLENAKMKNGLEGNAGGGGGPGGGGGGGPSDPNPFLPSQEAQRMMGSYPESDVARASLAQMNEISRRAEAAGMTFAAGNSNLAGLTGPGPQTPGSSASSSRGGGGGGLDRPMSRQDMLTRIEELSRMNSSSGGGGGMPSGDGGPMMSAPPPEPDADPDAVVMPDGQYADQPNPTNSATSDGSNPNASIAPSSLGSPTGMSHEGLQVFTLGHLMPKSGVEDTNGNWSFDASTLGPIGAMLSSSSPDTPGSQQQSPTNDYGMPPPPTSSSSTNSPATDAMAVSTSDMTASTSSGRPSSAQTIRVRRSTYVPGWAVPPRVLLVEDDAVSRRLSSKFLQVFGCNFDVAVDGVTAVNKMNLEKYDLVLMDIVMPKLDGVSATSLIRQFDHMTPIISMTSNSRPNEIMTYYSSGMNDILPKPFSKEGLLDMLEKHLTHLKVIQQMARVPRSIGIPPLSDSSFDQALAIQAANANLLPGQMPDEDGKINPLAGMGLSDEQYAMILQSMVNGETFAGLPSFTGGGGEKRGLDDSSDGRDGKRGRFEVVE
ncbi:hypothetical protein JAAARDRAFT_55946 [Jaapia argillacea MUCL 33604]|uniref:Response regulatory domain-containing protein n=1 Tax=Jaapia argillacea MUCL 33604 TaxID=933084 RepID=A0A067Q2Q7_9AGAM|nr:hypothetical protein JAAARDRAFT_55946 [Jaapia argillacea MUCL 33604]